MKRRNSRATPKRKLGAVGFTTLAIILVFVFLWILNRPLNTADFYSVGGQLLVTVAFAALGIWIADQKKWKSGKKTIIFGLATAISFLLWNLASPLDPIECSADVMLFKDGSGALLTPEAFIHVSQDGIMNELNGYDEITKLDQMTKEEAKKDPQYHLKLLAASTFSWLNWNHLDWSGYKAEPLFTGISAGAQYVGFDPKLQGKKINLGDMFGGVGAWSSFFLPPDISTKTEGDSKLLTVTLNSSDVAMRLSFAKVFAEPIEQNQLGIGKDLYRYYRYKPQPLSDEGFRVRFSLDTSKWRRWSKKTHEYRKWGGLFCNEYKKSFSWGLFQQRLKASFNDE